MDRTSIGILLLAAVFQLMFLKVNSWDLADTCPRLSLNCYECNTNYDSNCGDPFDVSRPHIRKQAYCTGCCMKIKITTRDGIESVQRKCTRDMNENQIRNSLNEPYWKNSREYGSISICDTNLCNGSTKQSTKNIFFIITSVMMTAVVTSHM